MSSNYFRQLISETPTRVWVNNPTLHEVDLALVQGAVGSTTNPTYGGGLLKRAPEEVKPVVADVLRGCSGVSDDELVAVVQRKLVARVVSAFRATFEASGGRAGFVSIQGPPAEDTDGEKIWNAAHTSHSVGPNATPKIPATLPGLVAFERVVESGWPVIVTEVFSLDQLETFCERYVAVTARTGVQSPFFVSPITGILGDHLKEVARQQGLDVHSEELELAGVYLARRSAALVAERNYPVTLLFGGARTMQDLTGLVGAGHHATINWSTFEQVLVEEPTLERTIEQAPDAGVVEHLLRTFPDFWSGWELGRLAPEEFEEFGPVLHFRDSFLAGWSAVRAEIKAQRDAMPEREIAELRSAR
jgi:transaldolase